MAELVTSILDFGFWIRGTLIGKLFVPVTGDPSLILGVTCPRKF